LVGAREDVRQQHVSILRAIANKLSDNPDAAVPYARLLVEIDPLDENSRARLSGFLVKLGRQTEAKQINATGTRLVRELGAEVSRELSQSVAIPSLEEGEREDWATLTPLVGRTDECARLRTALENARSGRRGAVALITGEPGVGKTRLLAELSSHVSSIRGTVLSGRSYEAEARRPYGPWVDAIQSLHPAVMGDVLRDNLA